MPRSIHPLPFQRRAWLLALGLLAMALHLLAGGGLVKAATMTGGGDGFVAELCTSHGVAKAGAASTPAEGSAPESGAHDCCKLCAANGPALAGDFAVAVPLAPTFLVVPGAPVAALRLPAMRSAHAPRGPPAQA